MALSARKFQPGQSGNPAGRRTRGRGMTDYIGKATEDGLLMAQYFVRTLKGELKGVTHLDKRYAATWLADRYLGKAVEVALTGDLDSPNNPLAELSNEQLKVIIHKVVGERAVVKAADASAQPETAAVSAPERPQPAENTDQSTQTPTAVTE